MILNQLNKILNQQSIKVLFTDYYDTLVHRTVHPNYTLRLWAKHVINELGLKTDIDYLYFTRQESVTYLTKKLNCEDVELSYSALKQEVCKRLINAEVLDVNSKDHFLKIFELADIKSEISVQYINRETLSVLKTFKENGGKIYLVSDFYGPKSMFEAMLSHHKVMDLFDGIYSSSSLEKSKHKGGIYPKLISELNLNPSEILMIGDNQTSDVIRAKEHKLNAFLMPHKRYLRANKLNNFGNDDKKLKTVVTNVYNGCNKKNAQPFSEYIVFYHVFTERLYNKCKQENIKDLFFLSREGQFLKKFLILIKSFQ